MSSVPKGGGRGIDGTLQKTQYGQHQLYEYPNPTITISNNQHVVQESAHMYRVAVDSSRTFIDNRYMPQYPYYTPEFVPNVPYIPNVPVMNVQTPQVQPAPAYVPPDRKKVLSICDPITGEPINLNKDDKNKNVTPDTRKVNADADKKRDLIRKEMNKKVLNEIKKKPENVSGPSVPASTVHFAEAAPVFSPVNVAPINVAPPVNIAAQVAPQIVPQVVSNPAPVPAPAPVVKKEATPVPEPVEIAPVIIEAPKAEPVVEAKAEQATEKSVAFAPIETEKATVAKDSEFDENFTETSSADAPVEGASSEALEDGEIVDDPETEVDAEEEARRKEAEEAEKRRERENELDELKQRLLNDITEVSLSNNCYGRAFLYCVRDIEKEFKRTTCPLTQKELENFGIDILSMPKGSDKKRQDFNPSWLPRNSITGQRSGRAQYSGRSSHNEHRGGRGSGSKKPYSGKGLSIDRPMEKKMILSHKADDAWKPDKLKSEDEEDILRVLLRRVRALLNKITPTTKEELIKEFLSYKICKVPLDAKYKAKDQLAEVVNIIFDKAVEEPKFCPLYSELCKRQVDEELNENSKLSELRNALLNRAQATFVNRDFQETFAAKMKAMEEEADAKVKAQLKAEIEEFEGKFRRRKFGNIIFIGQLYCQQLLSTKIVNWCLYDLIKHTHKTNEKLPEPPYDEESLQCAVQMLESLGKQLEGATDFPGKQYLDQTLGHLEEISYFCSNRIRFMILGVIDLRSNKWQLRKVVDQGPKKLTEIHNDIKQEQMENLQQRESYDKKLGLRTNGGSLRRQAPPPMRNSSDNRYGQGKQDKRAAAAASSKLTTTHAPPRTMSLSQASQEDKRKTQWKSGASGGGQVSQETNNRISERWNKNSSKDGSENRKLSSADDKAAAIAAAQRMGSSDQRSPSQMSSASQDNEESQEDKEERERVLQKLAKSINSDLEEVVNKEVSIEEMSTYLFGHVGSEKYGKPTISDVFQRLMQSAVEYAKQPSLPTLGHVLCKALQDSKSKVQALAGIANYCTYAVKTDAWCDFPKVVWAGIAEVIINSIFCETALFEGPRPCLNDFAESFINASKDGREDHTYELLVTVLRMMAEKNVQLAGEDHHTSSSMTFHELSFLPSLESDRLESALKACPAPENTGFSSLHALLEHL